MDAPLAPRTVASHFSSNQIIWIHRSMQDSRERHGPVKRTRKRYLDDSNIPIPKRTQMRRRCKTSLECDRDSQTDTEESDALSEMETAAEIEFETNLLVHALDAGPLMVADEQHQEPRPPLDVDSHESDDTNSHNLSGEACKDVLKLMKQLHPDSSALKDINYATLWSIA
ncbi:hypothetical protein JOQ06_027079, partial [Pogonophryne albipinna]